MAVKGPAWGNQYGKPDLERLGLFLEMPYMNGKGYVFQKLSHAKGRRMLGEGPKVKTGKQDCYFDKEFKRIYAGEALKGLRKPCTPASKFKDVSTRPFMPTGSTKHHSTPGDHYGTFSGKIDAFSGVRKSKGVFKHESRQCGTAPGRQGGPGYVDICLNKYPEHSNEKYGVKMKVKEYGRVLNGPMRTVHFPKPYFGPDPFKEAPTIKPGPVYVKPKDKGFPALPPGIIIPTGPAKLQGGCHAGCFDKFPEYKPDKYTTLYDLVKPRKSSGGVFYPHSMAQKSYYTTSVINENLRFRVNVNNYVTYEPSYIDRMVGPNFHR
ncbi:hypothetical protein NQ315_006443 [Exocentrus adspersus]|uniref:Cilia-and flagella-associated protein 96 n=1 Tax=Exocentrus adspersus TaxID=1586481 RepID=A0AAV8W026_9CUCU|nr:hypothetical protein NQ315_006443 [Exocentrus adspersus]